MQSVAGNSSQSLAPAPRVLSRRCTVFQPPAKYWKSWAWPVGGVSWLRADVAAGGGGSVGSAAAQARAGTASVKRHRMNAAAEVDMLQTVAGGWSVSQGQLSVCGPVQK